MNRAVRSILLFVSITLLMAITSRAEAAPLPLSGGVATSVPSYELPACEAGSLIEGLAVRNYDNGDFKIQLTPTENARWVARWHLNEFWHEVQACVPGLYDEVADRIYAQLACHADFSVVGNPLDDGEYVTGPTWDLESWKAPANEYHSAASLCSSDGFGYGAEHASGAWTVYYGAAPPSDDPKLEPAAATPAQTTVTVAFTGGIGLWTRSGPGFDAEAYEVLPDGTSMVLLCQTVGETISDWAVSAIWDKVLLADGQEVYVSDLFVDTGSNEPIGPNC